MWKRARPVWKRARRPQLESRGWKTYPVESSEQSNKRISNIFPNSLLAAFHGDTGEELRHRSEADTGGC
jgi:hypothetical protein